MVKKLDEIYFNYYYEASKISLTLSVELNSNNSFVKYLWD
jgi:hypothetical protein